MKPRERRDTGEMDLFRSRLDQIIKQFKRANRALHILRTYLGRSIRDITRQIAGEDDLPSSLS